MKNEKNTKIKLVFLWVFSFSVMIYLMSLSAKASSPYFPMTQNKNSHFSGAISLIENTFDSENNYYFVIYRGQNLSLMTDYAYIVYFPKSFGSPSLFGEVSNQNNQFSLYKIGNVEFTYKSFDIFWQGGTTPIIRNITVIDNTTVMWRTFYSSNYDNSSDYISNFRVYTDNSPDKEIILNYTGGNEYDDPANDTFPNNADKPDINDYIDYNDFPSFDSSDGIGSLWNIVKYSFGVVIPALGNYIVDSINWGFQKVINNIRNVVKNVSTEIQEVVDDFSNTVSGFLSDIQDFVSEIKDLVSDISDNIKDVADLFIHPFDEEEFEEQMEDCELINQYNDLLDNCDTIQQIFDYAEERDHFSLYIDFENPFADSEHKIIHSEISFDWLVPLRQVYRPFLWVFALLDCFVGGMRILGNIIGGKAK